MVSAHASLSGHDKLRLSAVLCCNENIDSVLLAVAGRSVGGQ